VQGALDGEEHVAQIGVHPLVPIFGGNILTVVAIAAFSASRSKKVTFTPWAAKALTVMRPIPAAPPVTRTGFPWRLG
jgi:hypothetical protein